MLSACESSQLPLAQSSMRFASSAAAWFSRGDCWWEVRFCFAIAVSRPHHPRWLQSECRSLAYAGMRSLNRHFYADRGTRARSSWLQKPFGEHEAC